jgi:hypothetical protein
MAVTAMVGGTDKKQLKAAVEETTVAATATVMETETVMEMATVTVAITMPTLTPTTARRMTRPGFALWLKTAPLPWPSPSRHRCCRAGMLVAMAMPMINTP